MKKAQSKNQRKGRKKKKLKMILEYVKKITK